MITTVFSYMLLVYFETLLWRFSIIFEDPTRGKHVSTSSRPILMRVSSYAEELVLTVKHVISLRKRSLY